MSEAERPTVRFRVAFTPAWLVMVFGAGLLAAGHPIESGADVEPPERPPTSRSS